LDILISTVGIQKAIARTVIPGTHIMFEAVLFIGGRERVTRERRLKQEGKTELKWVKEIP